jgi:hypothetical protein
MPFGNILPTQSKRIRPHVSGRKVHDLGCGHDLILSHELIDLGATEVVAVDTYLPTQVEERPLNKSVRYIRNSFENVDDVVDVAFVSWPSSHHSPGLIRLLSSASTVIYLGTCMDGLLCGSPELFRYLATREVLEHEPDRHNTLIVYGEKKVNRSLLPEELAGIDLSRIYFFDESRKTGT